MNDPFSDFDLKLTPDWLKESGANPYENFAGEDRRDRDRDPRRSGNRPPRQDSRSPRANRPPNDRAERSQNRPPRRDDQRAPFGKSNRSANREPRANRQPAQSQTPNAHDTLDFLKIEFLPNEVGANNIAQQIKSGHRAYPLFSLARMFLEKPERYQLRLSSSDPTKPLYRVADFVALDKATAERVAFIALKHEYYSREETRIDPPKGNFTSVARCRLNDVVLGPSSHHSYQLNLRRLYEERFSRHMSFPDFQRTIEIVNDPAAVEAWKEKESTVVVFKTLKEAEPITFRDSRETEEHFRKHYLSAAITNGDRFEASGVSFRNHPDRRLVRVVREAWDKEKVFPSHLAHELCTRFIDAGLHTFKHRKRFLYVSNIRPVSFPTSGNVSPAVTGILRAIEEQPRCTRNDLGAKLLAVPGESAEAAEQHAQQKTKLAADLHYLIQGGHVIEFHDGKLDLPLTFKEASKDAANRERVEKEGTVAQPAKHETPAEKAAEEISKHPADAPSTPPEPIAVAADKATEAQAIGEIEVAEEENNDIVPPVKPANVQTEKIAERPTDAPSTPPEPIAVAADKATEAQAIGEIEVAEEENNDIVPPVEPANREADKTATNDSAEIKKSTGAVDEPPRNESA